jgi:sulfite oxidase
MTNRRLFLSALSAAAFAADTPKRDGRVLSTRPFDVEMDLAGFADYLTPIDRFYVRTHHYTPALKAETFKLEVGGEVANKLTLSLDDIRKMPAAELVSVCECAGNGRSLYEPSIVGLQWEYGGVGNAKWRGVRLAEVLKRAGVNPAGKHVLFNGGDTPVGKMPDFQRTIPLAKALDPNTLLAYEMNGETLPVSHGFPLRVVVPGWAGDSWVKWLTDITILDREFDGFFMKTGYRHPGKPVTPGVAIDPAQMKPVESLRIKSVIASPLDGSALRPGTPVRVSGAAWSGMSPVARVEVSVDRGRTWKPANLGSEKHAFGWRLWHFDWTPSATGYHVLMARARDISGDSQPFEPEWNPSGYLWNVVHRVAVDVTDTPAAKPPAPAPPNIPELAAFREKCLACHDEKPIAQQRLTRAQWDREVTKMTNWGANVKANERDELIDYLTRRFGPRPRR